MCFLAQFRMLRAPAEVNQTPLITTECYLSKVASLSGAKELD